MEKQDRVIMVEGEAPESSDEEIESFDIPVALAREVLESESNASSITTSEFPSVYHKKLYQKNEDLWSHMSSLLSRTIETSSKNLIETDKLLVKCQVTLQSVSTSTKKVNKEMNSLTCNIKDLFSANFLPTVSSPTH